MDSRDSLNIQINELIRQFGFDRVLEAVKLNRPLSRRSLIASQRRRDVNLLVALGKSNRDIADSLGISVNQVRIYRKWFLRILWHPIMRKRLGVGGDFDEWISNKDNFKYAVLSYFPEIDKATLEAKE